MNQVPAQTSAIPEEPAYEPYVIPFAPELIPFIEAGNKVRTYRFGLKYDYLKVGDHIIITDYTNNRVIGTAMVIRKSTTTFAELPLSTEGHETYKDKEHQRRVFNGYYRYIGREITDDDIFLIIDFQLRKEKK